MNLVFAGTPDFAVPSLEALIGAGQPDRPAGRGRKLVASAIKSAALAHNLPVHQPAKLSAATDEIRALAPDAMIVVAYGQLLRPEVLAIPAHGCINVHASLLPRWRGAAPIARAIEAGDAVTGVTIMRMDAGLDTGPMLAVTETPIHEHDNAATLHDRLARLGAQTLAPVLAQLAAGTLAARAQPDSGATYAAKLKKEEAAVDWSQPGAVLHRKVRAFNPYPVAVTLLRGKALRLWDVGAVETGSGAPGEIVGADREGLRVQTGAGILTLTKLQGEGGKVLTAAEFVNGSRVQRGERLGT
jgi:methionyl-tRNA formyltransferase